MALLIERLDPMAGSREQFRKLGHEVRLAPPLEDVDALLGGQNDIAVEVRRSLLELGEVFDRLDRPLPAAIRTAAECSRPEESASRCGAGTNRPV